MTNHSSPVTDDREQIAAVLYVTRFPHRTWLTASLDETALAYKQADAILSIPAQSQPTREAREKEITRLATIAECAKIADEAKVSAQEHHGVEASIGADIAARRIRALALTSTDNKARCNHWPGQDRCGVCGMDNTAVTRPVRGGDAE